MAEVNARKRGNTWQYYYEGAKVNGKRTRVCKSGFKTKKEALLAGSDAMSREQNGGTPVVTSDISVADFTAQYLEYCEKNFKYNTWQTKRRHLNCYFVKNYGRLKLSQINIKTAEDFVLMLKERGLARNTIIRHVEDIRSLYNYAIHLELVYKNPFKEIKIPSNIENPGNPHVAYTDQEIEKLLDFYKDTDLEPVLMIGYHCGLRIGELIALTWDDIDFEAKKMTINKQLIKKNGVYYFTTTKYNSDRVISMDDTLVSYLKQLKESREPKREYKYKLNSDRSLTDGKDLAFVVTKMDGKLFSANTLHTRLFNNERNGMPSFKVHDLRHTHCTKLISSRMDLKYVQQRLGHKHIQTTLNTYHHILDTIENSETEKLNSLF